MFDTRSGFWLMASIVITAVLATGAVILFAPDDELTYSTFATAIGFPMAVILPMIAILSVTSEWSQRSGLTTFTLVPHRSRVISAKAISAVAVGVVSMLIAFAVGALGNVVGTAITGTDLVWDASLSGPAVHRARQRARPAGRLHAGRADPQLARRDRRLLRLLAGAADLSELLATSQDWFSDLQPWVDFNYAQSALFNGDMTGEQWANLAVAGSIWLLAPLAVGVALVMRSEVK